MTPQERQALMGLFAATAMYFNHEIPDAALRLYAEDLEDLPFEKVAQALKDIRRDPRTTRCPLPAQVRGRVNPQADPEHEATEAAARILQAIQKFGHPHPKQAQLFIGELGWAVVQREGGWQQVCEVTNDQLPILKAQWRKLALAVYARTKAGHTEAPGLPGDDRTVLPFLNKTLLPEMPKVRADEGNDE